MQIEASDILFVINPNSGSQKPDTIIKQIKNSGYKIDYILTQKTRGEKPAINWEVCYIFQKIM